MPRNVRVLFVGDSVTAGYGLSGAPSFVQLAMQRWQERGLTLDVCCDALDGADSAYLLRRFDRMVTSHDPDWVVFSIGLNDALPPQSRISQQQLAESRLPRGPADFAANVLELIDRTITIGAHAVLMTPNPRFTSIVDSRSVVERTTVDCTGRPSAPDLMPHYADVIRGLADALRLPLVDVHRAFLAEPDPAALLQDGTHPTARGHELMADLVTEELLCRFGRPQMRRAVS